MREIFTREPHKKFYAVVRRIPTGRVASYAQVAALAGLPGRARQVGQALRGLADDTLPWHRVVNAQGKVSVRGDGMGGENLQRAMLEAEGIRFSRAGRIDMEEFGWDPPPGAAGKLSG